MLLVSSLAIICDFRFLNCYENSFTIIGITCKIWKNAFSNTVLLFKNVNISIPQIKSLLQVNT